MDDLVDNSDISLLSAQIAQLLQLEQPYRLSGQMRPIRDDQIENSAGGFVWQISDLNRIRRFLILGTTSGSYYATEQELTIENVTDLIEIIDKGKGGLLLKVC